MTAAERSAQRARTIGSVLRSITSVVIGTVAAVMVLAEFNVNLAPILASAGIVGLAVGFGAQNLVRDFLSGMFMLLEDQYGVGDIVDVGVGVRRGRGGRPADHHAAGRQRHRLVRAQRRDPAGGQQEPGLRDRRGRPAGGPRAPTSAAVTELLGRVAAERVAEPDIADDVLEPPEVLGVERVAADGGDAAGHRAGAARASSSPCSGR